MEIEFKKKYFILEGREYLIRSKFDEERVLKKQAKIARRTGKKPNVVISLRND